MSVARVCGCIYRPLDFFLEIESQKRSPSDLSASRAVCSRHLLSRLGAVLRGRGGPLRVRGVAVGRRGVDVDMSLFNLQCLKIMIIYNTRTTPHTGLKSSACRGGDKRSMRIAQSREIKYAWTHGWGPQPAPLSRSLDRFPAHRRRPKRRSHCYHTAWCHTAHFRLN